MCEYCTTDRDGYVSHLPRVGTGNAHIRGRAIVVSGPNRTNLDIEINFCPMCGRKLGGNQDDGS